MRILLCHNYYQLRGGEDQSFEDEAELLRSRGHFVATYTTHNDTVKSRNPVSLAARTLYSREAASQTAALIAEHRPDVLHCTNSFPLLSPSIYGAAHRRGVAVVQALRNYRFICAAAGLFRDGEVCEDCVGRSLPWPALKHRCYRGSLPATATTAAMTTLHRHLGTWRRHVDLFFTLSEFARAKLVAGGVPEDKLAVKPNFVAPDPGPERGDGDYIVFAGRLAPEKGVECLLDAFAEIDAPTPLVVVGDGPLRGRVQMAAARDPRIDFRGHLPLAEVMEIVRHASLSVCPSVWYEPFGRTIIESFAVGTPVVAARHGAMTELVEDGVTGRLVSPDDAPALARTLRHLLDDRDLRAEMGASARREYELRYTADANYDALIALYERALRNRGRA